ncbi:unnamed protein product [Polarella glacialis]|uniref:Uncharacterized protein n=1 Tax=Polarella glacialis TaxID=89957 RepID=A0A813JV82_POLGL|nr:unnamed protein product [Polarella glacialis]
MCAAVVSVITMTVWNVTRYSIVNDQWEELPKMPCERDDGTAVVWQNQVLLVAGVGVNSLGDDGSVPLCVSFNPMKKCWQNKMTLQTPRQGAARALLDGKLYVCGGNGSEHTLQDEQCGCPEALALV